MPIITRHLAISGRVQGVWFRESMRLEAERLGVTGWVRNARDGVVEAVVQGEERAVAAMIAWSRIGPPAARVDEVIVTPAEGSFTRFERLPTA
ncbi:MAG: acylphosphatase [Pseudomonadota bacterium]|nr:acylphosphatase [Pseudomonadota bacterium]